ncbi:MAG: poly-gamma-glutamate hydrolase family protein [Steroidobacteraceae bacterium]
MADKYRSFGDLARRETAGKSWRIETIDRRDSNVLVIALHGGRIERGTSELAAMIAGDDYSLYCFEGVKRHDNSDLHITSHHFNEPTAPALAGQSSIVVGIHGCRGDEAIHVGGLDAALVTLITDALVNADMPASADRHEFPAIHPHNICNRSSRRCGARSRLPSIFARRRSDHSSPAKCEWPSRRIRWLSRSRGDLSGRRRHSAVPRNLR